VSRDAEHVEQSLLMQWADAASGRHPELRLLYAIPNGGHRHVSVARKLKAEGVKRGVPDLCLPVPRGTHHALYVELKAGKNRATPEQKQWLDALWTQGNEARVCVGWEAARDCITEYLALPRCVIVPLAESP
jgi:hypothetical protein